MIAEYKKRLHKIWKSQLNSRHKVDATNTPAISLLRYRFMTVKWTRKELRYLDVLTRKVLRRYQSHHLNERVYLPCSQGGRGFMICLLTLGAGGSEPGSLPHNHPRSNHGCGVQAPTAVGRKELLQFVTVSKQIHHEAGSAAAFPENPPMSWKKVIRELQKAQLVSKAASKQHQGKFMSDMRCQAALNETLSV